MEKYLRVIPKLTDISETTKRMVLMENIQKHRKDSLGVCKKENEAVDRIKTVIWKKMIIPYQTHIPTDLVNISTEKKASTLELFTANGIRIMRDCQESTRSKNAQ